MTLKKHKLLIITFTFLGACAENPLGAPKLDDPQYSPGLGLVLSSFADQTFPAKNLVQGIAMTPIDFQNAITNDDSGITYACTFDGTIDGSVVGGSPCSEIPGLSFNTVNGILSGTPTALGSFETKITGTSAATSASKILVLSVAQAYSTENLLIDLNAQFGTLAKLPTNSPLTGSWTNLTLAGTTYDGVLTNFAGSASSGWAGSGIVADPYRLVMDGVSARVDLGTAANSLSQFTFSTWIAPLNAAATSKVIVANNGTIGNGMMLKQSDLAGRLEFRVGPVPGNYPTLILASFPNLYWRMNDSAGAALVDASPNGCNGVTVNSPTLNQAGALLNLNASNNAIDFNGTNEWAYMGCAAAVNPTTYTEEVWIKTSTTTGGFIIGFSNTNVAMPFNYDRLVYMANSGQIITGVNNPPVKTITSPLSYNDGQWHHVVATLSEQVAGFRTLTLYVDGRAVQSRSDIVNPENFNGFWRIGTNKLALWDSVPTSNYIAGTIDEVAIYPTALSESEILAHYDAGRGFCLSTTTMTNGTWKNVTGTFDGTIGKMFVNGTQECSANFGARYAPASTSLSLGATSAGAQAWQGAMGSFQIYNAVDLTKIVPNYNATAPRFP